MVVLVPRPARPTGVTILTILQALLGVIDILTGVLLLVVYALASAIVGVGLSATFGFFLLPLAVLSLIFGALSLLIAYGLWTGQWWAWIASIVLAIIGLVVSGLGLLFGSLANVIPIVFYALILVYLNTNNVRAFFGRSVIFSGFRPFAAVPGRPLYPPFAPPQYAQPAYQQSYYPQPQQRSFQYPFPWGIGACPNCGTPIQPTANFCDRCGTRLR